MPTERIGWTIDSPSSMIETSVCMPIQFKIFLEHFARRDNAGALIPSVRSTGYDCS